MPGTFVFLTGQSGAGKTTLFKGLFGWEKFDRGQILVGGINVGKLNEKNLYQLRRKVGLFFRIYVFHTHLRNFTCGCLGEI